MNIYVLDINDPRKLEQFTLTFGAVQHELKKLLF